MSHFWGSLRLCGELMTKNVASCYPDERADLTARLMRDRNVGALIVIGCDGHPVGFVTDRDFAVGVCANAEESYYRHCHIGGE